MSDYLAAMKRMGFGGKGWTFVLGGILSLGYVRARLHYIHDDVSQPYHDLKGERGELVPFKDQPKVPGRQEDIVLRLWRQLPDVPLPNLYIVAPLLTAVWAYRMWGVFNRLMVVRFGDIHYQIIRPDVLNNKIVAVKYLALPLAIVPGCALLWYALVSRNEHSCFGFLQKQAMTMRASFAEPCRDMGFLAHEIVDPLNVQLNAAPLATFARRSQTVGRENHLGPGDTPPIH